MVVSPFFLMYGEWYHFNTYKHEDRIVLWKSLQ